MARYEIAYDEPRNKEDLSPIEEYLEKKGYKFSLSLSEDGLSAVLTSDDVLEENSFHIVSHYPHTEKFARVEN